MGNDQSKDEEVNRLQNQVNRKERELSLQRAETLIMERKCDAIQKEKDNALVIQNEMNIKDEQKLQRQREKNLHLKRTLNAIRRERDHALVGIGIISAVFCAVLFGTSGSSVVFAWTEDKLYADVTGFSATIIMFAIAYSVVFAVQYGSYRLYKRQDTRYKTLNS